MTRPNSRFSWPGNDRPNGQPGGEHAHLKAGETNGFHTRTDGHTHGYRPNVSPHGQNLLPPYKFEIRQTDCGRSYIVLDDPLDLDSGPIIVLDWA